LHRYMELSKGDPQHAAEAIAWAQPRIEALKTQKAHESSHAGVSRELGITFLSFYCGQDAFYAYGVMTVDELILMNVGDIDPETGISSSEMRGPGTTKIMTTIIRKIKSAEARRIESEAVKMEIARVKRIPLQDLKSDRAFKMSISRKSVKSSRLNLDKAVNICSLTLEGDAQQKLFFTKDGHFTAEQISEILRRK
jgi:hypothetical protein